MPKKYEDVISIDNISFRDIRLIPQRYQAIAQYYWDHYSYFSHQRSLILEDLKESLTRNCHIRKLSQWQRVVSHKYTLDPLSTLGSIINGIGGRFNIGNIDPIKFPRFPALYLAETRDTAYKEKFALYSKTKSRGGLSAEEFAQTSHDSISIFTLKSELNQILDLTQLNSLKEFFNLIKNIKLPRSFISRAQQLNIHPMFQVKTIHELRKTILLPNWRFLPMQFDVPSNPQILGQIAYSAGIEGILYPSRMNDKDCCLALFPENLINTDSFVEIQGKVSADIKYKRLDSTTVREMSFKNKMS